jgi:hypothetical protein
MKTEQSNQSARVGALQSVDLRKFLADGTVCQEPFFSYKPPTGLKRLGKWLADKLLLRTA